MIDYRKTIRLYYDYVLPTYKKTPIVFQRGKNTRLWDAEGNEYLDFFAGFAVSNVGHCHKRVVEAIKRQAERLLNVPNNYYHEGQGLLAEKIVRHAFPGKVFFCNSGTEAVEGALKVARRFGQPDRFEIITMKQSFHGRTFGALSATGQSKVQKGLGPLLPGFLHVPFNDFDALKKSANTKTSAVLLELVQGEGGVHVASSVYVRAVRDFCRDRNILLIIDEVQTGIGRTGKMFCYKNYGIEPDMLCMAKGLGGGIPIGAFMVKSSLTELLSPGEHGSTFGGNPLSCAAALAVLETIEKEKIIENAFLSGSQLIRKLSELGRQYEVVRDVRGLGLLAALELEVPAGTVYEQCRSKGLLLNVAQENVVRLAPPLTVTEKDVDYAVQRLDEVLNQLNQKHINSKEKTKSHAKKKSA
jgi:acetylornithine/N-succinyldiaminopimelate aminotransferase